MEKIKPLTFYDPCEAVINAYKINEVIAENEELKYKLKELETRVYDLEKTI